jgi:hypothetical protein
VHDRDRLFIPHGRRPGEGGARVDLRIIAFFGVVLLLLALAGWLYLRQASEVAELASEVRELELEKEARQRALVTLRGEVAMLGSLKRVLVEGIDMGYRLPDAASSEELLVIACSADCTAPKIAPANAVVANSAGAEPDDAGVWNRVIERFSDWIRMGLPAW